MRKMSIRKKMAQKTGSHEFHAINLSSRSLLAWKIERAKNAVRKRNMLLRMARVLPNFIPGTSLLKIIFYFF